MASLYSRCWLLTLSIVVACLLPWSKAAAFVAVSSSAGWTSTTASTDKIVRWAKPQQDDDGEPQKKQGGLFGAVGSFFEELDAFLDDATARRLGNGAAFYGKRRSNFYGEKDAMKKRDRTVFDPLEDYQGPTSSGFFKWMPDENGSWRPVTRMKSKIIEQRTAKDDTN